MCWTGTVEDCQSDVGATPSSMAWFRAGLWGRSQCHAAAAAAAPQARMKQLVLDEVKGYFRPELLNRFDEQIVFHKLGLKEVRRPRLLVQADIVPIFCTALCCDTDVTVSC